MPTEFYQQQETRPPWQVAAGFKKDSSFMKLVCSTEEGKVSLRGRRTVVKNRPKRSVSQQADKRAENDGFSEPPRFHRDDNDRTRSMMLSGCTGETVIDRSPGARESLLGWRRALARCSFTTLDGFDFLDRCQDVEANGICCDAPFPGPGDSYKETFTPEQHVPLAGVLDSFQRARIVCRFYDHPLVRELYPESSGWVWRSFKGRKQSNAEAPEVLILNGPSREGNPLF